MRERRRPRLTNDPFIQIRDAVVASRLQSTKRILSREPNDLLVAETSFATASGCSDLKRPVDVAEAAEPADLKWLRVVVMMAMHHLPAVHQA
jgi:hypothetical protein